MKIIIRESQYKVLSEQYSEDVVFGKINEVQGKILSPEEEDEKIKEILNYVRNDGNFSRNSNKDYIWLKNKKRYDKTGKFQDVLDQITQIQKELENKKIEEILDYVRNGGDFTRDTRKNENYKWLVGKKISDKTGKFQNVLDQITQIQEEFENKKIKKILDYIRSGGIFVRDTSKNQDYDWLIGKKRYDKTGKFQDVLDEIIKLQTEFENDIENKKIKEILDYVRSGGEFTRDKKKYKWLHYKTSKDKTGKFQNVSDQIEKIQKELGIKKEWWGEKTTKDILEGMGFYGVVNKHRYKECKNSISCRQYEFDVYLPYNKNNYEITKNNPEFSIIPKTGIIFEYDGRQHFEFIPYFHKTEEKFNSQIFRDKEKNLFCENNNIKLVRIPYTSKTKEDIARDIESSLNDPSTFILTGDYPKAGWNK